MGQIATSAAANFGSVGDILIGPGLPVTRIPPRDVLFGFDAIIQFSRNLLQTQLIQSLTAAHLSKLGASVPWGTIALPSSLLDGLSGPFRNSLSEREAFLEIRLVNPYIGGFHWPPVISVPPGGQTEPGKPDAILQGTQRLVDVGWRLEVNVMLPQPAGATTAAMVMSGGAASGPAPSSDSDSGWTRLTLAAADAVTATEVELTVSSGLWQFGVVLNFADAKTSIGTGPPAITDLVATDAGSNLLSAATAPLRVAHAVKLSPDIAPGGSLAPVYVQRLKLPSFRVEDLLLYDAKGNPLLCLCAEIDGATNGVTSLVQPILDGNDFAYGVSTTVLNPGLKAQWYLAASGLSFFGEAAVELPVDGDSSKTAAGRARMLFTLSNILDDVSIVASTDSRSDPLRLLSRMLIQLVDLWDSNGNPVTNLGPLGQPQQEALALPFNFFDPTDGPPKPVQQSFLDLLMRMATTVLFPLLEPFLVNGNSLSGFSSSAMKSMLVRWALQSQASGGIFQPNVPGSVFRLGAE